MSTLAARTNIFGLSREELATEVVEPLGLPLFRVKQLWHWIYLHGERDFTHMTTVSRLLQQTLQERFCVEWGRIARDTQASDGTRKWLVENNDQVAVECVYIPEGSMCVSSQAGCSLRCAFCRTGTQRLQRNLSTAEIVGQFMLGRSVTGDFLRRSTGSKATISSVVFMGQGEPLFNYANVRKAVGILRDKEGLGVSKRRITISTAGVAPLIEKMGSELGVNLAVSLHAVTDDLRNTLVPLNRTYPLRSVLEACARYPASNSRRIAMEYVMLKGVNDTISDARELVRLIHAYKIHAFVNLIPFNPWEGTRFECSSRKTILAFGKVIQENGVEAAVRWPRGREILAACGQLIGSGSI